MKYRLVRGSEVQDFLRCRKRWKHKWVDRIKPKRPDGKLFFGNLFHKFVETYYKTFDYSLAFCEMQDMFNQTDTSRMEQTELDDLWDLAVGVTEGYVKQWGEKDKNIRVIATEFTFAIPLANGIAYTGTIDKLWLDENGKLWFADYKTTSVINKYIEMAKMDRQISRYFWALKQLCNGEGYVYIDDAWWPVAYSGYWRYLRETEPHSFVYDIVLRDVPKKPKMLKEGRLSVAKNQKTTYAVYLQALIDHDIVDERELGKAWSPPEGYEDILNHLAAQETEEGNAFFRRIPVYRHPEELESAIQEFYAAASDMIELRKKLEDINELSYDPIYRNITSDCSWDCAFHSRCLSELDGTWNDGLLDLFYEKEEPEIEFLEVE